MAAEPSLWSFIADAGPVVKFVILTLVSASAISWMLIFQRGLFLKQARVDINAFEDKFWSGIDLNHIFTKLKGREENLSGLERIFYAGFKEYSRLGQQANISPDAIMEGTQRSMRVAQAHEVDKLESHLSFLATVGSISPYVGLFGTVWGIMTSFRGLIGSAQQATINMVAPGISEALIATAIGLFAAIPAVIAYNRFSNTVERLINHYDTFQEEFSSILHREAHAR